jgi:hypothetical protein
MSQAQETQLTQVVEEAIAGVVRTVVANYPDAGQHLNDPKHQAIQTKFEDSLKGAIRMHLWLGGQ